MKKVTFYSYTIEYFSVFSSSFSVLGFTSRSSIHLKLVSVQGDSKSSNLILLCVDIQLPQNHLLKMFLFPRVF